MGRRRSRGPGGAVAGRGGAMFASRTRPGGDRGLKWACPWEALFGE